MRGKSTAWTRMAESGNALTFHFCPTCGSTVYWEGQSFPGYVAVAIGTFADPNFPGPTISVWEDSQTSLGHSPARHATQAHAKAGLRPNHRRGVLSLAWLFIEEILPVPGAGRLTCWAGRAGNLTWWRYCRDVARRHGLSQGGRIPVSGFAGRDWLGPRAKPPGVSALRGRWAAQKSHLYGHTDPTSCADFGQPQRCRKLQPGILITQ